MTAIRQETLAAEIFDIAAQIPRGRVTTYGRLAQLAGAPAHARLVGRILSAAPAQTPCHRVVNSQGGTAPHWPEQRSLLEAEGVVFRPSGRVDLRRAAWEETEVLTAIRWPKQE